MANFSAITQPANYTYGYSAIPLRVIDTDALNIEQYKYIINILFNKLTVSSVGAVQFNGNIYALATFATPHRFKIGDVLYLNQTSGDYTDYYTVMSVPSTTSVILDIPLENTLTGSTTVANVIKYKLSPDPDGEAKLDLSNTIKDYVTENLSDVNEIFSANDTRFNYELSMGYEGKALFQFDDNVFQSGNAGFVATGLTATTQVAFEIGDQIIIEQELYSWPYTDNFFSSGRVGLTGSTPHYFTSSDTVTVTGQITNPSYNGLTTLFSTTATFPSGANNIVLNKSFLNSSPVEGGTVYGVIIPEYNTTATITDIVYSAGTGVIITTDIPWAGNSPAIGGTIKHSDGKLVSVYEQLNITGLSAFNSYVNQLNYSINGFDEHVIQNRSYTANCISTIYDCYPDTGITVQTEYRIEKDTKSWLLAHNSDLGYAVRSAYIWLNSNNSIIGVSTLSGGTGYDFYFPIGINQVYASTLRSDSVPMSGIINSISSYYVYASSTAGSRRTNLIKFFVNEDCSGYETYHLMWKDALGSWISYPFKYISQDSMDVDRKNYYRTAGNWRNGSFGYDSFDRGEKTFFARSRDKIKLNSGWINDSENALIKDLMQSANVYVQYPDGTLIACTIDNKEIVFGNSDAEQIYQYSLNIITSNNEIRL